MWDSELEGMDKACPPQTPPPLPPRLLLLSLDLRMTSSQQGSDQKPRAASLLLLWGELPQSPGTSSPAGGWSARDSARWEGHEDNEQGNHTLILLVGGFPFIEKRLGTTCLSEVKNKPAWL